MKKFFSVIFLVFALTVLCAKGIIDAPHALSAPQTTSKSALLMNFHGGEVVYSHNADLKRPIASMCKIMTLLLTFEEISAQALDLNEDLVISQSAARMGGSQAFLEANGTYKVSELVKSVVIASANDSSVALAERICGSETAFVDKMNEKAAQLGMKNTLFSNCTGLPRPNQHSTAYDCALMLKELLNHKEYFAYSTIWMDEIAHSKGRVTELTNTNRLVRFYEGCDSGKTGYTSEAGHCLAASAKRGSMRLISVVIGAPDSTTRFEESKALLSYGFDNYTNRVYVDSAKALEQTISVRGGKTNEAKLIASESFYRFTKRNEKEEIELELECPSYIKAPAKKGDAIGKINVYKDKVLIGSANVELFEDINEKTYGDYLKDIGERWAI